MNGFYHHVIKKADDSNRGTYLGEGGKVQPIGGNRDLGRSRDSDL